MGNGFALGVEDHHAIQFLGLALELEDLAPALLRGLGLQCAIAAPAAPQVAIAVHLEAVQGALVSGIDQLGLVAHRAVGIDVIAPDAAVGRALPLHNVQLLLIGREGQAVGIDDVGDDRRQLAVGTNAVDIGRGLLWLGAEAFPLAVDAEQRVGEPDGVVGLNHDVVGRIELLALIAVGQHRQAPALFGAHHTAGDGVLAGDEAPLPVTHIAIGPVGGLAEHREAAVALAVLHDAIVGNVADQHIAPVFREVHRAFGPAHACGDLLHGAAVDAVLGEAGVQDLNGRIGIALVGPEVERLRQSP